MDGYAIIETIFSYITMFPSSFSIKYIFIWKNKIKELIKEIIKIDFLLTIFLLSFTVDQAGEIGLF